jgi:hypothetical protein
MSTSRSVSIYAVGATAGAIVLAPLFALAYLGTPHGAADLEVASVAAWAHPARAAAGVLLTFAAPERVYATYTQLFALLVPALLVTAQAARRARPADVLRGERIGWAAARTGYAALAAGIILAALVLIGGDTDAPMVNAVFLTLVFPGILISVLGSTVLGVALLRAGYQPRATAWLLTLAIPGFALGSLALGHNSLGLVPLFLAWSCTAWAADMPTTDTGAALADPGQ